MNKQAIVIALLLAVGAAGVFAILRTETGGRTDEHGHGAEHAEAGHAADEHEDDHAHTDDEGDEHADHDADDHNDDHGDEHGDEHEHDVAKESGADRVRIPAAVASAAGITLKEAGPANIRESLLLYGAIVVDPKRQRQVTARFPGVVRSVGRSVGDTVGQGDTLAAIESNESLESYPVRAPIAGVILERNVNPGDNAADQVLFTIADLRAVSAELAVFRRDLARVRVGQTVRVRADDGATTGTGTINFISPVGSSASQTVTVRVGLDNPDGHWQPGIFVTAEVETASVEVPVAVSREALQTYENETVVFTNDGDTYAPRPLELGRRDAQVVEVRSGLKAGERYVAANSFVVKADLGKAGAGHDH